MKVRPTNQYEKGVIRFHFVYKKGNSWFGLTLRRHAKNVVYLPRCAIILFIGQDSFVYTVPVGGLFLKASYKLRQQAA